jgi:hypothetical protein
MNRDRRLTASLLFWCVPLVVGPGCGSNSPPVGKNAVPVGKVTGKVLYNGNPLGGGSVTFHSPKSGSYRAEIKPEGTYELSGLPLEEMTVTVETETAKDLRPGGAASVHPPYADRIVYVPIPRKYADAETSGLKYAVAQGEQTHDFRLEGEPAPEPQPTGRGGR